METYSLRMSQEIATRCSVEPIALPGRADGRGPSNPAILWFGIKNLLQAPFRSPVDVVHLGDMAIWPLGYFELLLRRANRLVVSAHGSDVSLATRSGWQAKLYRLYLNLGARLVPDARIVANSSYIADLATAMGFRNVALVPLGTDIVASGQPARSGLLFAGRVSRAKGLRFLTSQVLPLLPPETRLRVAGPVWDDTERELIEHPQVEYLGMLSPDELAAQYSRAAITLIPSQIDEGFGLVAIEAAACGSQVIASNGGGLREVVRAPWGDLVSSNDPAEWASAIRRRTTLTPNELDSISEAAKQDVERNFRWRTVADRTLALYSD